ncbi:hypothetical protein [Magnetospirillum sp. SS-4]|uniref:hypothetical protein n=1 Tax=Magnetospirillum sp. SS-4 TaxID=2681465 RepID=UPI0015743029|nr:hypothetical protein [Magnetospirillum sp. SS-4]
MIRRLAAILCVATFPAMAGEVACPDLATAVQVGDCPTEKELMTGFNGYCSDNARIYDKGDGDTCHSLDNYKKLKDTALWEAGDFQGYLHCATPAETRKNSKLFGIKVLRTTKITRVICTYDNGEEMTLRTRAECTVQGKTAMCKD